jgi:UDP-glucuronate 4-epimerase
MAYYDFSRSITQGKTIFLFNSGDMYRDFTFVSDIVESIKRLIPLPPEKNGAEIPYRILNLGNSSPVYIRDFITILEEEIGKPAIVENKPNQITDVYITYADTSKLEKLTGFTPATDIRKGLAAFSAWFRKYHGA